MVDEGCTFFITKHVHFSRRGNMKFCKPLKAQVESVVSKGFLDAEVYFKMRPDGSPDLSDAMHIWWKDRDAQYRTD